jgi:hypothetical protein
MTERHYRDYRVTSEILDTLAKGNHKYTLRIAK